MTKYGLVTLYGHVIPLCNRQCKFDCPLKYMHIMKTSWERRWGGRWEVGKRDGGRLREGREDERARRREIDEGGRRKSESEREDRVRGKTG